MTAASSSFSSAVSITVAAAAADEYNTHRKTSINHETQGHKFSQSLGTHCTIIAINTIGETMVIYCFQIWWWCGCQKLLHGIIVLPGQAEIRIVTTD